MNITPVWLLRYKGVGDKVCCHLSRSDVLGSVNISKWLLEMSVFHSVSCCVSWSPSVLALSVFICLTTITITISTPGTLSSIPRQTGVMVCLSDTELDPLFHRVIVNLYKRHL